MFEAAKFIVSLGQYLVEGIKIQQARITPASSFNPAFLQTIVYISIVELTIPTYPKLNTRGFLSKSQWNL